MVWKFVIYALYINYGIEYNKNAMTIYIWG